MPKKKERGHTRVGNGYLREGSQVKGNRLLLLIYLESRADKSRRCFPSIETIGRDLDLSPSTVKRGLSNLEDLDLILRLRDRSDSGQWERTIYEVAEIRQGPGVTVAPGPGVTVASGPGVKSRGQIQGSQRPTNNYQENKTQGTTPNSPPGVAHSKGTGRAIDPEKDIPGWVVFKTCARKIGISAGQIADLLWQDFPRAYLLGYFLEKLRKGTRIRKTPGAWLADKCKRKKAPPAVDYDLAKVMLRPYLDRVALPGMRFPADVLKSPPREESQAQKKKKALDSLEGEKKKRRALA